MRVTCPKCQCKGVIDATPGLSKAQVICARCEAVFETLLIDGVLETRLPIEPAGTGVVELAAQPRQQMAVCGTAELDEVLVLPQISDEHVAQADEPAAVLELLEPAQPAVIDKAGVTGTPAPAQTTAAPVEPDAHQKDPLADSGSFKMPAEYQPQFSRSQLTRQAEHDKYSMGVRLLRVSPLWLLACGLSFIGLVVALNGLTGTADKPGSESARGNTTGNQATNQNKQSVTPDQTTRSMNTAVNKPGRTRETERAATTATPTDAAVPPARVSPAQPQPRAETPRQQVEVKAAPTPAATPQTEGTGRFTLQVGSYNTPVEANERAARLQAAGFSARVVPVELPNRGTWYRVQTGRYGDRAEAQRAGAELRARGAAASFIVSEVTAR